MRMTIAIPSHLSDGALIAEVTRCARDERHATAQLIAHLAELDARRLYLGAGHSSLFAYCRDGLGLSDDAAYNRVEAARACRLFPGVLEQLVDGSLTVTSVRLLARLLTAENHRELLALASRRSKREVEELIAHRFPRPDTPTSVRKVPERTPSRLPAAPMRPVTEPAQAVSSPSVTSGDRRLDEGSRHVAAEVKRIVWVRDGGRCAFVGASGHRCSERAFLEYHHVVPYAVDGKATIANIQLRCRAHNGYEADVFFGTDRRNRGADGVGERSGNYAVSWGFSPVPERPQPHQCPARSRPETG
jgi:hypothetical protein